MKSRIQTKTKIRSHQGFKRHLLQRRDLLEGGSGTGGIHTEGTGIFRRGLKVSRFVDHGAVRLEKGNVM